MVFRHVIAGLLGAAIGIVLGWLAGEAIGERLYADCIELDCLAINLWALAGSVVVSIALAVLAAVLSLRAASRSRS